MRRAEIPKNGQDLQSQSEQEKHLLTLVCDKGADVKLKSKMKKIMLILIAFIGVGIGINAQDGSGSCKLPGTYDYAKVDFYKGPSNGSGHFIISNQSNQFITEMKVRITATIKVIQDTQSAITDLSGKITGYKTNPGRWESVTLYDATVYQIGANQTPSYNVPMPQYYDIKNINVSVGNLICKPIEEK